MKSGIYIYIPVPFAVLQMLRPFSEDVFTIHGSGWKKSCKDIVLSGLGWVSVTGAGDCCIKVSLLLHKSSIVVYCNNAFGMK